MAANCSHPKTNFLFFSKSIIFDIERRDNRDMASIDMKSTCATTTLLKTTDYNNQGRN